jgi:hypothetical protein
VTTPQPFQPASAAGAGAQPGAPDATIPMPSVPGPTPGMPSVPGAMPGVPGPMPVMGPPGPYEISRPRSSAVLRKRGLRQMIIGGVLFVIGLLITAVTYRRASSSVSGGSYIVAFGPMIIGAVWALRGARLVTRSRSLDR